MCLFSNQSRKCEAIGGLECSLQRIVWQIDELVAEALKLKGNDRRDEIKQFAETLSDMQTSLKVNVLFDFLILTLFILQCFNFRMYDSAAMGFHISKGSSQPIHSAREKYFSGAS